MDHYRRIGSQGFTSHNLTFLAYAYACKGEHNRGLAFALKHFNHLAGGYQDMECGFTYLAVARVLQNRNNIVSERLLERIAKVSGLPLDAGVFIQRALSISSKEFFLETLIPALVEQGIYRHANYGPDQALKSLTRARKLAQQYGMQGFVAIVDRTCARLQLPV